MAVGFAAPAQAQRDMSDRISRLENEIETLNRAVYKGERPPVSASSGATGRETADLLVRIQQLEGELRDLTGKIEQQSYDNQQIQMRLDALEQDSRMRLEAIETQLRGAPAQTQTPVPAPAQTAPVPPPQAAAAPERGMSAGSSASLDAAALYEQGFGEIKQGDYAAAEGSFAQFIKTYPDHALAPNAMYWLGETHYVRKQYDQAARVFAEAYQKYPNGPKGADNLLKLGMSLAGAGKKGDACIALAQLKKQYPDGPPPILNKGDQEIATLGCS